MTRKRSAQLSEIGEDALVATLTAGLELGEDVQIGAGDDCAVIGAKRAPRWTLLKTDAVVEGVHFGADEDWRRVGQKAMNRAISDIAAMGGVPQHALVAVAVRREESVERMKRLYQGMEKAARAFEVAIVGGETSRSPGGMFLSVTLTGWVERERCVLRSGGKPGDAVYVTGRLGGSIAGRHLDFKPRVAEARWLVESFLPSAMMDLSDGIGADLPRLADASGCGYELWRDRIPKARGCTVEQALSDGEDYELLFTIAEAKTGDLEQEWKADFPKVPLTRIGALVSASRGGNLRSDHGFDHFA
ncbi:MAG: thiamine-phosphate kinase [Chthoniobacteraceae bacterium]